MPGSLGRRRAAGSARRPWPCGGRRRGARPPRGPRRGRSSAPRTPPPRRPSPRTPGPCSAAGGGRSPWWMDGCVWVWVWSWGSSMDIDEKDFGDRWMTRCNYQTHARTYIFLAALSSASSVGVSAPCSSPADGRAQTARLVLLLVPRTALLLLLMMMPIHAQQQQQQHPGR